MKTNHHPLNTIQHEFYFPKPFKRFILLAQKPLTRVLCAVAGANWGSQPKHAKWNSAESAVIQQVGGGGGGNANDDIDGGDGTECLNRHSPVGHFMTRLGT